MESKASFLPEHGKYQSFYYPWSHGLSKKVYTEFGYFIKFVKQAQKLLY